jgi:hypothetical protein
LERSFAIIYEGPYIRRKKSIQIVYEVVLTLDWLKSQKISELNIFRE